MMFKNADGTTSVKKIVTWVIVLLLIGAVVFSSVVVIPPGHTGVVVTMGKVSEIVLQEGLSFKIPFVQQVVQIDNRITLREVETQAFSSDLQTISAKLAVNYRIDKGMSYSVYKNVGATYEAVLIIPSVNEVLKAVVAQYTASELVGDRSAVSVQLNDQLKEKLQDTGIIIEDINIIDWDFSDEYIAAIEQKQVAEQNLIKTRTEQEQAVVIAQAEAEKQVIAAQAAAEAAIIEAEARAKQIAVEAEAQAAANRLLAESLSDTLIDYETVQKWNGELPKVQSGDAGTIVGVELGE